MDRRGIRLAAMRPLAAFLPWANDAVRRPGGPAGRAQFPLFTLGYLAATWALFVAHARRDDGHYSIDQDRLGPYLFRIPDLSQDLPGAVRSIATAPWLNHNDVQLIYISLLLLLVGAVFEAHEGTLRTIGLFFGTSVVGAVCAGALLHLLYPEFVDTGFFARAWARTWSGGSVGCFGLMGAMAARARTPWPLLAGCILWEVNVVAWYLREYTPAFHLTGLAAGFVALRYAAPLLRRYGPSVLGGRPEVRLHA